MTDCVFCKIVARQIPATVVHEDAETLAFMDIGQVNPGHVLVACKAHVENIYGLSDAQAGAVFRAVAKVARAVSRPVSAPAGAGSPPERSRTAATARPASARRRMTNPLARTIVPFRDEATDGIMDANDRVSAALG